MSAMLKSAWIWNGEIHQIPVFVGIFIQLPVWGLSKCNLTETTKHIRLHYIQKLSQNPEAMCENTVNVSIGIKNVRQQQQSLFLKDQYNLLIFDQWEQFEVFSITNGKHSRCLHIFSGVESVPRSHCSVQKLQNAQEMHLRLYRPQSSEQYS